MGVPDSGKPAETNSKLKVFLSYSRKDSTFAAELLQGLELLGFEAYLDKEDIAPGEPWEERLGNLIRSADTVVFILSPNSVASTHCSWEVEETAKSGKRLVPVILQVVPDAQVPERLRRLNYVFFNEGQSFAKSLGQLAHALRADAGWIREHSRILELATRWIERDKTEALLLRGSDLEDAKKWAVSRPQNAPEISASQQAFIEASSQALSEEIAAKVKLRSRVQAGLAVAACILAGLAGFSFILWQAAERAKGELAETNGKLKNTVALLDATNARLERKLALRAAPRGYGAYDVPAGWFQIATKYAGTVAFIERKSQPERLIASGVLVNARALNTKWDDKPVFVTATYVVGSVDPGGTEPSKVVIVMLGPGNERRTAELDRTIFESKELGVSVSTIKGPLPADVTPIPMLKETPAALADLPKHPWSEADAMFDDRGMLKDAERFRPIVFIGNLLGRKEVAISISHLLGSLRDVRGGVSNVIPVGKSLDGPDALPDTVPDLVYTHGTLPGGGGSPIFDAETGDLIGIHLTSYPCPSVEASNRRCAAAGTSITHLLTALRAQQQSGATSPAAQPPASGDR